METINIMGLINSEQKFCKVWESSCQNHRILYVQIDKEDEGIPAHFHPNGEDSAIVLQGNLLYDVRFDKQVNVFENEIVFGWTNYVHGYHNENSKPLHILIFATPEQNWSDYNKENLPEDQYSVNRSTKISHSMQAIESKRMVFFSEKIESYKRNTFCYNWSKKELWEIKSTDNYPKITPECIYIQFK